MCEAILTLVLIFLAIVVGYTVVGVVHNLKQRKKTPICTTCLHCMSYSESATPSGTRWTIKCNCGLGATDSQILTCSRYELDPDSYM